MEGLSIDFKEDLKKNKNKIDGGDSEWAHWYVGDFLEAMAAWLKDSEEFKNSSLSWKDLADIIESGKFYE